MTHAYLSVQEGNHERAVTLLERSLAKAENAYARLNLALFYSFLGRIDDAAQSAAIAHERDKACPVITAAYVCLSFEATEAGRRKHRLNKWLDLISSAQASYQSDYLSKRPRVRSESLSQSWRSMLYLVMTRATLLLEKKDPAALQEAAELLSTAEAVAPFEPWVRSKIAAYYEELSKNTRAVWRPAYLLKAKWHKRASRHLSLFGDDRYTQSPAINTSSVI
jgi:hypothetical protein